MKSNMEHQDHDIVLLYGSQTGNAEDLAKRIGFKLKQNGYSVYVQAMDEYPLKNLVNLKVALFVCSTTGHGSAPANMKNFYNFIRRSDLPSDCLENLNYAVFGLGDSSYAKFNWVSKVLFKRLKACGAKCLQDLTIGDEQHPLGCDGDIYPKLEALIKILNDLQFSNAKQSIDESDISKKQHNSYNVEMVSDESIACDKIFTQEFVQKNHLLTAECFENQRITSETHFQDTRFFRFQSSSLKSDSFEPGDVCCIYPANTDENVHDFAQLLGLNLEQKFSIHKRDPCYMVNYLYDHIPEKTSVKTLVKYYLDLQSVAKRSFFEFIWPFSKIDSIERGKLLEFASTEGQEEMYEYCIKTKRTILEVLADFPNTVKNIKFEYLFDIIPPIKPRSFSIASSSSLFIGEIHLIVGVVEYKTQLRKKRKGLCSNYLAGLCPNKRDEILFSINKTDFRLPSNKETPIIMIGPGLGIAPFRSFLQQRIDVECLERNYLYFGCRLKDADFYFEEELNRYCVEGKLNMQVCFSRQNQGNKSYVQELVKDDNLLIYKLMNEFQAVIYIAGNSRLPDELRQIIGQILYPEHEDPLKNILLLESNDRIQYDCW